ncbi:TetR/AcrR family transcriptional regulator [Corynebacterium pygosceleis]|uniref:TetR/AcrR family transcriptional regulator n=1 Tax=Corynebacterium pygosceleis TaxID=2800406 RepID=A0A9Q4C654_9CORY|nr:TetR/AcrR family transcriptional regulator [Corynebacterium pygosceleis]MCK7636943.1 TetR/AcrR family transcriptional regulator [Corynebacterium pygosceleis]MCK7674417.1 TetR/AcrR family transcriptional regulator [Corynebacterium pygosceleis]MCL0120285.1 TetR/AcrR family transcriptional regulator [Corynebacterium pygosceleis]MCX7443832.1 TetR/AcrR family transcriptional regulator [Corynebacterium pygosceleis]MCX7467696.1 TetR/AcrR family transcriptional regulator [Corynebacterium pygoscelei
MRADALERRNRIIDTACELFRLNPETVPLEIIAEKADVGIATLYRNFPDRGSLLHACGARLFVRAIELQHSVLENFDDDPGGQWLRYVDSLVDMGLGSLVAAFAPDDLTLLPPDVMDLRQRTSKLGDTILAEAKRHGLVEASIRHDTFIIGLLTVSRPPVPGVLSLEPNITANLVEIFLSGLRNGTLRPLRY